MIHKRPFKQVLKGLLIGTEKVFLSAGDFCCDKVDTSAHLASDLLQALQRFCNNCLDYLLLPQTTGCFIRKMEVQHKDPSVF